MWFLLGVVVGVGGLSYLEYRYRFNLVAWLVAFFSKGD